MDEKKCISCGICKQTCIKFQIVENTNIDKVNGDDLIKGGRLQDTSELVTVEDNKTPKVNNITKKNKSIELR